MVWIDSVNFDILSCMQMHRLDAEEKGILRTTVDMAWPAILESFFVAFAGLVDSYMVSSLGANAVAAVGLTMQPKFLGLSLFFALNLAISALVARRFGEQKRRNANEVLVTSLIFLLIAAVVLSVVFVVFASPLMHWCGSTEDTHDMAVLYFQIVMGGMIFNCLQMGINAAQRGAGNTQITMRTNVVSNVINIIFNYLLIGGHLGFPALGILGAALATVLGTVVACVMSIVSVCKPNCFVCIPYVLSEKIKASSAAFKSLVQVGYSVFFEQILIRIGFLLTAVMAADQGTSAMAAHQVGMNLLGLSFSFGDGLQVTAVALIGRSLGQGKPDLAKRYGLTCRILGGIITVILAVIYFVFGKPLFALFFAEPDIVEIGKSISYVIIFVLFFQIAQVIYMGCLRGAGDTLFTAIVSAISVTIIRTAGSYICGYVLGWGIIGIWMGVLADQASRFICSSLRFKTGKWVQIKI